MYIKANGYAKSQRICLEDMYVPFENTFQFFLLHTNSEVKGRVIEFGVTLTRTYSCCE
jgi:hypothetical protein